MKRSIIGTTVILAGITIAIALVSLHGHGSRVQAAEEMAGTQVTIDNFSFTPPTITVPVGSTVTWVNKDDVPHTVVENNHKFKSKALDTDESFTQTFTEPGTYDYFCSVHPKMVAKVIVQPKQ